MWVVSCLLVRNRFFFFLVLVFGYFVVCVDDAYVDAYELFFFYWWVWSVVVVAFEDHSSVVEVCYVSVDDSCFS